MRPYERRLTPPRNIGLNNSRVTQQPRLAGRARGRLRTLRSIRGTLRRPPGPKRWPPNGSGSSERREGWSGHRAGTRWIERGIHFDFDQRFPRQAAGDAACSSRKLLALPEDSYEVSRGSLQGTAHAASAMRIVTPITRPTISASRGWAKRRTVQSEFGCGIAERYPSRISHQLQMYSPRSSMK